MLIPTIHLNSGKALKGAAIAMTFAIFAASLPTSADAGQRSRDRNAAIAGGVAGGIIGAAVAPRVIYRGEPRYSDDDVRYEYRRDREIRRDLRRERRLERELRRERRLERADRRERRRDRRRARRVRSRGGGHVERCYRAYRSYNERTDTFIGYDGIERVCRK